MTGNVLILGASGRFGRHAAEAFETDGWSVTRFKRGQGSLSDAARGMDVIVNAWNPVYTDWATQVPKLTARVIEAAKTSGATVIIPGNVYPFGADAPECFGADTPHRAQNPLGKIRADMEAAYKQAGVRTIILRCGDFLDTEATGNWFDQVMITKIAKGVFTYPGNPNIPHAWAWLPDAARAAVALAGLRATLPAFADVPFEGYTRTGEEMRAALARVTGNPVTLKQMNWVPLQIAKPFWPMGRRLIEMSYLWRKPHFLDRTTLRALVPDLETTPLEEALGLAIQHQIHPDKAVA